MSDETVHLDMENVPHRLVATLVLPGRPRSKKNSRTIRRRGDRTSLEPSDAYKKWAKPAVWHAKAGWLEAGQRAPVGSAECKVWLRMRLYYPTLQFADQSNAVQGPEDILQRAGVLTDDRWVSHHDGTRSYKDARKPRAEVDVLLPLTSASGGATKGSAE